MKEARLPSPREGIFAPQNLIISAWLFVQGVGRRSYFWLFALLLDPFDIYNRYKPTAWPRYEIDPSYFWVVLGLLILWTAILTYHELRMGFVPVATRKPDPPDVVLAKSRISDFIANELRAADMAVSEAVRLSAYAFMHAWNDTPAGKLGWSGILSSGLRRSEAIPKLTSMEWMRASSLPAIEQAFLGAIVEYRSKVHKLHEVVSGMVNHGRLQDHAGFFDVVRKWRPLHDTLLAKFRDLQRSPEFPAIRDADEKVYLNDPNFDLEVLIPILA